MKNKASEMRAILAQWEHQLPLEDLAKAMEIPEAEAREIVESMAPDYRIHKGWVLLTDNGLDALLTPLSA